MTLIKRITTDIARTPIVESMVDTDQMRKCESCNNMRCDVSFETYTRKVFSYNCEHVPSVKCKYYTPYAMEVKE